MSKAILITIAIFALSSTVYMVSRVGYESADYTVVSEDGDFEIRDYEPMLLVSTSMTESELRNSSPFGRLFQYITGSNEKGQKISMTSPVLSSIDSKEFKMSFLIPKDVAKEGAPEPTDDNVKIEPMEGGKFAVYRFSGYSTPEKIEKGKEKLSEWLEKQELKTSGAMLSAGYDPPNTPGSLRRNEILIRLEK